MFRIAKCIQTICMLVCLLIGAGCSTIAWNSAAVNRSAVVTISSNPAPGCAQGHGPEIQLCRLDRNCRCRFSPRPHTASPSEKASTSKVSVPPPRPIDSDGAADSGDEALPREEENKEDSDSAEEESSEESDEEEEDGPSGVLSFIPHEVGPLTGEAIYQGEWYSNTRGGLNTNHATRYRGNIDLIINGDLEELFGWEGASVFLYGGQVHGQSISLKDVGDWQILSEIDPAPLVNVTQMQEYWIRQEYLEGQLYFKLGRQDANADFGFSDLAGDFVNNSFVTIPTIPFPVWPAQSLGVSGFLELSENWTLGAGIYESNRLNSLWGEPLHDKRGQIALGHLEWRTQSGPQGQHPGTWRVGAWLDNGQWGEITTAPVATVFCNNYGFWFSGDQMLFKEEYGTDDEQGLGVFCEIGWSPGDRNFIDQYYGAGLVYRGLIPGRDEDLMGVGIADIQFSRQTFARDGLQYERAVELFYKARVSENLTIQPDMQFIANPGGNGRDALAVGLRFELVL